MGMSPLVPLAMFGWIPVGMRLFKQYNGQIAVIAGFLIAWGFLPCTGYSLPVIPDYSKSTSLGYVMMIGVLAYDRERLMEFKLHLLDYPILIFCFSSMFSSVSNGLGAYDGFNNVLGNLATWYLPYLLGRLYFTDLESFRILVLGLFIGGLLYIPFCMWEDVMSPNLHKMFYGFHAHEDFSQSRRWGGWRPMVFMKHGLMVAVWMANASVAGVHLLMNKQLGWLDKYTKKKFKPLHIVGFLVVITILCKSMGSLILMFMAMGALMFTMWFRTRLALMVLMLLPLLYVTTRVNGSLTEESAGTFLLDTLHMPEERVGSLTFRLYNEDMLMEKAFLQPLFGWGGWMRSFVFDAETGEAISVPDGMWIIMLGQKGLLGLVSFMTFLILPQWLYLHRFPPKVWKEQPLAVIGLAPVVILSIFVLDSLLNDMFNPLVLVLAGGMTSIYLNANSTRTMATEGESCLLTRKPRLL